MTSFEEVASASGAADGPGSDTVKEAMARGEAEGRGADPDTIAEAVA